jgi:MFS family permease
MAEPALAEYRDPSPAPDERPPRLWGKSFLLLWQGQLVSALGDVIYEIALGFWILATTGSTGLMGTLMAASAIPRVLVSPFAGVWVDRSDRKRLLVAMDVMRGVVVTLVGVAAAIGAIQLWMVFAAGVVIGLGGAFFSPSVGSVIPDIVERDNVIRANSFFSMIQTGSSILGNSAGGFLYAAIGAPFMFLANGISYLVSAFSMLFLRIPRVRRPGITPDFWSDLRDGVRFAWGIKGLRYLFIIAAVSNFLAVTAIVLILPLFQRSPRLGPGSYGIAMAFMAAGMLMGMATTAVFHVKPAARFPVCAVGIMVMSACWALFPMWGNLPVMVALICAGGAANAVINVMIGSVIQLTVPQHMRGKVGGFLGTISQGLTPIAMALGGLLGEFLPIRWVIFACFCAIAVVAIPLLFSREFRRFISYDPPREPTGEAASDAVAPGLR